MSEFNYGINCSSVKEAKKLLAFIEGLDLYQDGLDVDEERVNAISTQALLKELESFAKKFGSSMTIEVWSKEIEYDDAEANGTLEVYKFSGKPSKGGSKPSKYAAYSGQKDNIQKFKKWLTDLNPDGLIIIEEWELADIDNYGIEFTCNDAGFDSISDKQWLPKGVITEKKKK